MRSNIRALQARNRRYFIFSVTLFLIAIMLLLAPLVGLVSVARADSRGFQWDYPPAQLANIDGFKFYCGPAAGQWDAAPKATIPSTSQTSTITIPAGATWWCVVRAYKGAEQSGPSNEVSVVGRPDAPTNLRVSMLITWDDALGKYIAKSVTVREVP